VEIGANTAIDRPAVGETRIGAGTKIDNLVQIAHGVTIGRHVLLAGQVGIAGQHDIEDGVVLAGQVGVAGHLTIGAGVIATAQTGIPNSVDAGAFISGYPAIANRDWLKSSAVFRKLPELRRRCGPGAACRELERGDPPPSSHWRAGDQASRLRLPPSRPADLLLIFCPRLAPASVPWSTRMP
jgi:hypothetical protein